MRNEQTQEPFVSENKLTSQDHAAMEQHPLTGRLSALTGQIAGLSRSRDALVRLAALATAKPARRQPFNVLTAIKPSMIAREMSRDARLAAAHLLPESRGLRMVAMGVSSIALTGLIWAGAYSAMPDKFRTKLSAAVAPVAAGLSQLQATLRAAPGATQTKLALADEMPVAGDGFDTASTPASVAQIAVSPAEPAEAIPIPDTQAVANDAGANALTDKTIAAVQGAPDATTELPAEPTDAVVDATAPATTGLAPLPLIAQSSASGLPEKTPKEVVFQLLKAQSVPADGANAVTPETVPAASQAAPQAVVPVPVVSAPVVATPIGPTPIVQAAAEAETPATGVTSKGAALEVSAAKDQDQAPKQVEQVALAPATGTAPKLEVVSKPQNERVQTLGAITGGWAAVAARSTGVLASPALDVADPAQTTAQTFNRTQIFSKHMALGFVQPGSIGFAKAKPVLVGAGHCGMYFYLDRTTHRCTDARNK